MERKIVVPEGMLAAAWEAVAAKMRQYQDENRGDHIAELHVARISLEAALRWLSENPIVPSVEQCDAIRDVLGPREDLMQWQVKEVAFEWQRHMFLAPEAEIPEEIRDIVESNAPEALEYDSELLTKVLMEAYCLGQKEGKS